MRIAERYSHLNGWEYLQVHHRKLWSGIEEVIGLVDSTICRTKISKEARSQGKVLYSAPALNAAFKALLAERGWDQRRVSYWVTRKEDLIRKTLNLSPPEQKKLISESGAVAISSYNQTDFVRDRVAIEVQFGKYSFVAYDLFVKHLAFYVGNVIDVGIEILPMKSLQAEMTSGVAYFESEIYNVVRQGRGVPAVPLILIGVEA